MPRHKIFTNKDFNPGNARWCEDHNRLECTKNRNRGRGVCHKIAIKGINACDIHSGYKRVVAKAQGQARITAWNPAGAGATIDAGAAVLSVLQMTYLRLGLYAEMLRRQVAVEGDTAGDAEGTLSPQTSGLIGHRYGMGGKEGIQYVQTEEVRALVMLEAQERDRVVKFAKTAHDMGISERLTSIAERWGDVVATRIATMLDALGLTPEQAAMVPDLLQSHLGSIDMEGTAAITDGRKP